MKKILCLIVIVTILMMIALPTSASITMDTDKELYATQPINSLYINELGHYISSPTFNKIGYATGLNGSGDTLTNNQRYSLQLGSNSEVYGEYGVIESLVYLPMNYIMYYSNAVCSPDFDSRFITYFSDLSNFHKLTKPVFTGTCTFYFTGDSAYLEAFTIDLTDLNVECEKLGQYYKPELNGIIYNYVYSVDSDCFAYRLHSPQWYAYQYALDSGVPQSLFDNCVAYTLNDCVVSHDFEDDGAIYMLIGTKIGTTIPDMTTTTQKIIRKQVINAEVDMFQEDTWLEDIANALDEVAILDISFLTWFYVIFGIAVFGYVMKLLMGG